MKRLICGLVLVAALLSARSASAQAAVVQGPASGSPPVCTFSGTTVCTIIWPAPLGSAHTIGMGCYVSAGTTVVGVPSDSVNTYSVVGSATAASTESLFTFYAKNTGATSNNLATTISAADSFGGCAAYEISGEDLTAPLDTHDENTQAVGSTLISSNAITTTTTGIVLVFGANFNFSTWTAGSGYTLDAGALAAGVAGAEHKITGAPISGVAQTINNSFGTGANSSIATIAFKDAGGGGGGGSAKPCVIGGGLICGQ